MKDVLGEIQLCYEIQLAKIDKEMVKEKCENQ